MTNICDFVESTERGDYRSFWHKACDKDDCEIIKYGLGEEDIKQAYEEFIKTDSGNKWLDDCKSRNNGQTGDCGDYIYDFYPEVLM